MDEYRNHYLAVPVDKVVTHTLPPKGWYNSRDLNQQFVFFGLKTGNYSYASANTFTIGLKIYLCTSQEEFEAYIMAYDLNADLRNLFHDKPVSS